MEKRKLENIKSLHFSGNTMGVFLAYVIIFVLLSVTSPVFFTFSNIMTLGRQAVCTILVAMGMTFIIGMGGIDLSVGSVVAACGVICAAMVKESVALPVVLLVTLIAGAIFGCINGLLIAKLGLADFVATLATMSIVRGLVYVYTKAISYLWAS